MYFFGRRTSEADAKHRDEQLKNGASKMAILLDYIKGENESMLINE